jgi:TolB-like protein
MNPVTQLQTALAAVYRIEREIGRGGMAAVYLARDLRHERLVAIKVLEPRIALLLGRDRFLQEIRLAARLQHPHIVPVHDSGAFERPPPDAPGLYYVMPFVEGESLRARLSREGSLPVGEAVRLAGEVADALACAHAHGVLHRDIKPENILLSQGHALVTDFGIAKALPVHGEGADGPGGMTATGLVLGTAAYMSPEQASGARDLDARTDLYSLGCVVYEMLAGRPPFRGATPQATLVSRLTTDPPGVRSLRPEVPVALEAALARALAREPEARFASAPELAGALASAAGDDGSSRRSGDTQIMPTGSARARHRAAGLAAIALLIGLIAVFALGRRPGAKSPAEPIPVAVLPFRTLGGTGPALPLAVGIPDAIISRLAGVGQLRLRPTSAILRYADRDVDLGAVGRELAVDYLLTGTVQDAGDRLRISVQLVRSRDGAPLWGTHYDLPRQDLLTLQDSIAARVSEALAVRMTSAEQERLYRRYTRNSAAFEAFLRGRVELARLTEPGARAAVAAFEQALALDGDYALAHAGLAMASADMHLRFAKDAEVAEWGTRARREATRALALDSTVAEAHLAQAAVYRKTEFDWDATILESRRALELNPSLDLPHYFIAAAYYHLGLLDRAGAEARDALLADPTNHNEQLRTRGVVALLEGGYREAIGLFEQQRRESGSPISDSYLSQAYWYSGDTARARAVVDSLIRSPAAPAAARGRAILASFLAAAGDGKAAALLDTLKSSQYMDHHVAYSMAIAYAQLGRFDEAREWLRRSIETGFACYPWFERDPLLEPLRRDAGSRALFDELKRRWEAVRLRYEG